MFRTSFRLLCDDIRSLRITVCPIGSFTNAASGSVSCTPCASGYYRGEVASGVSSATTCYPCVLYQNVAPGTTACTPCSAGYYSSTVGAYGASSALACTACPADTYAKSASGSKSCFAFATCTVYPAGKFSAAASNTCVPCTAPTYRFIYMLLVTIKLQLAGSSSCTPCAAGTYSATGGTLCLACTGNTYSVAGSTTCAPGYVGTPPSCTPCTSPSQCSLSAWDGGNIYSYCISCIDCMSAYPVIYQHIGLIGQWGTNLPWFIGLCGQCPGYAYPGGNCSPLCTQNQNCPGYNWR